MHKVTGVAVCLLVFASASMAEKKLETKWHCTPAKQQKYEVGDTADHAYNIAQGTCTVTASNVGEKSGQWTEFQETWKSSFTNHGRFNVTMDDGDKTFYTYEGSGDPGKKSATNKWKIVGGTGKQKGAKGSGSCTGKLNDDGSSDWECSGKV